MVIFQNRVWERVGAYFNHILLRDSDGREVYVSEDDAVNWYPTPEELLMAAVQ